MGFGLARKPQCFYNPIMVRSVYPLCSIAASLPFMAGAAVWARTVTGTAGLRQCVAHS